MKMSFVNRNAFVTGGSSGIGFSIAELLLKNEIDNVVIVGSNQEKLMVAKSKLEEKYPGKVHELNVDLSNVSSSIKTIGSYINELSFRIDILVNNAGVMCNGLFPNISEEEYDRVMSINLKAVFFLSELFSKYMILNEIKGNILMVCSTSSFRPALNPYMLSKWGVKGLTVGLAKALLPFQIVVNGVAPGPTATPMLKKDENDLSNPKNPSGRYCTVEEVANLVCYLLSEFGKMIVGEVVSISGGAATITFDDQSYKLPDLSKEK